MTVMERVVLQCMLTFQLHVIHHSLPRSTSNGTHEDPAQEAERPPVPSALSLFGDFHIRCNLASPRLRTDQSRVPTESETQHNDQSNEVEDTKRNQYSMDEDRNDDCEPANKAQAETFWHAWSQVSSILATPNPIYGNRCYSYVSKQCH